MKHKINVEIKSVKKLFFYAMLLLQSLFTQAQQVENPWVIQLGVNPWLEHGVEKQVATSVPTHVPDSLLYFEIKPPVLEERKIIFDTVMIQQEGFDQNIACEPKTKSKNTRRTAGKALVVCGLILMPLLRLILMYNY